MATVRELLNLAGHNSGDHDTDVRQALSRLVGTMAQIPERFSGGVRGIEVQAISKYTTGIGQEVEEPWDGDEETPIVYWTVFGNLKSGGRDDFCDCADLETALFLGAVLGMFFGVQFHGEVR